jgi:hypothetical protein
LDIIWKEQGFIYKGEYRELNEHTLLLDGSLSREEAAWHPHAYCDIREAFAGRELSEGSPKNPTVMYIAPNVYWIDDPLATDTMQKKEGDWAPFGMHVESRALKIVGLSENPENIVIAGNRGQSHACNGNYTLFCFRVEELYLANVTLGNYCSVDLVYPANPALNQKKRTETVTQAQLAFQKGEKLCADNCRFVSRLNLVPVCGAKRALYRKCHFESTDDALNGNAVYVGCDFDFYGNRPIYQATGTGAVFIDCIFRSKIKTMGTEAEQYLTKEGGQVALIDCRYETEGNVPVRVGWTKYPLPSLKCYQYGVVQNGKPVTLGGDDSEETVQLQGKKALEAYVFEYEEKRYINIENLLGGSKGWNPPGEPSISKKAGKLRIPTFMQLHTDREKIAFGEETIHVTANVYLFSGEECQERVDFFLEKSDMVYAELIPESERSCRIADCNRSEQVKQIVVHGCTESGLEASVAISVEPFRLPAPELSGEPVMKKEREIGCVTLSYELSSKERTDASEISWYRCDTETGTGAVLCAVTKRGIPLRSYRFTAADIGKYIKAVIIPRLSGGLAGTAKEVMTSFPVTEGEVDEKYLFTDFSELPDENQPELRSGSWTLDCARPIDIEINSSTFGSWEMNNSIPAWQYGETGNGSKGVGFYQNTQGARLRFTPVLKQYGDMSLKVKADPAKTAGQGFGSTGQYMDFGIKFHTEKLTGYALRVIRVKEASDAVAMALVEYRDGKSRYLTALQMVSCYLTGFCVTVRLEGTTLTATAECDTPQPVCQMEKGYAHELRLETEVSGNQEGGILVWHTGTPGTGGWQNTTMLHSIEVEWK